MLAHGRNRFQRSLRVRACRGVIDGRAGCSAHPRRSSLHLIGGALCRLHDRVQPIQDRLPLREVGLDVRRRQVEN